MASSDHCRRGPRNSRPDRSLGLHRYLCQRPSAEEECRGVHGRDFFGADACQCNLARDGTVYLKRYAPGVGTAVLLVMPVTVYILRRALREGYI